MNFEISSPSIGLISEALSKAQGKIENALKDSKNPFFKSTYADLSSVMAVTRGPLSDHQLSFSCSVVQEQGMNYLVCTLSHSSGEWFRSYMPLIVAKQDMQSLGAAISYGRRFCLSALCHVGVEDDDGEETVDRSNGEVRSKVSLSDNQMKLLKDVCGRCTQDQIKAAQEKYGVSSLTYINPFKFSELLEDLGFKSKGSKDV